MENMFGDNEVFLLRKQVAVLRGQLANEQRDGAVARKLNKQLTDALLFEMKAQLNYERQKEEFYYNHESSFMEYLQNEAQKDPEILKGLNIDQVPTNKTNSPTNTFCKQ